MTSSLPLTRALIILNLHHTRSFCDYRTNFPPRLEESETPHSREKKRVSPRDLKKRIELINGVLQNIKIPGVNFAQ